MPTVLITGANRGLGLEFARQYAGDGWTVLATCRRADDIGTLETLGSEGDVRPFVLDVSDFDQIDALAGNLSGQTIDVLLNNAGLFGPKAQAEQAAQMSEVLQRSKRTDRLLVIALFVVVIALVIVLALR